MKVIHETSAQGAQTTIQCRFVLLWLHISNLGINQYYNSADTNNISGYNVMANQ